MVIMLRIAFISVSLLVAVWCLAPPAYAYLDPGTGSTLLQGLIGGVAVATGFVAYSWRRLRALLFDNENAGVGKEHPER
jgi:hypothetical protein